MKAIMFILILVLVVAIFYNKKNPPDEASKKTFDKKYSVDTKTAVNLSSIKGALFGYSPEGTKLAFNLAGSKQGVNIKVQQVFVVGGKQTINGNQIALVTAITNGTVNDKPVNSSHEGCYKIPIQGLSDSGKHGDVFKINGVDCKTGESQPNSREWTLLAVTNGYYTFSAADNDYSAEIILDSNGEPVSLNLDANGVKLSGNRIN